MEDGIEKFLVIQKLLAKNICSLIKDEDASEYYERNIWYCYGIGDSWELHIGDSGLLEINHLRIGRGPWTGIIRVSIRKSEVFESKHLPDTFKKIFIFHLNEFE